MTLPLRYGTNGKNNFQSYEYYFKNDVEKLLTNAENFDIIFICDKKGTHPKLVRM